MAKQKRPIEPSKVSRKTRPLARLTSLAMAGALSPWRAATPVPDRITLSVPDLFHGEAERARAYYLGVFEFGGVRIDTGGRSPFDVQDAPKLWLDAIHSFEWLRDHAASGDKLAATNARAMLTDWQASDRLNSVEGIWTPVLAARRLKAMLRHHVFIASNAELAFYRNLCGIISAHCAYLRPMVKRMHMGEGKLEATVALALAAKAIPLRPGFSNRVVGRLGILLDRRIGSDGAHISRNADMDLDLLHDLIGLRETIISADEVVPETILGTIDKLFPALRTRTHADSSVATFNGSGTFSPAWVAAILASDTTGGSKPDHLENVGHCALRAGHTTAIMDFGTAQSKQFSQYCFAGLTALEMSSDGHQIVINTPPHYAGEIENPPSRKTSLAHSMAVLDGQSLFDPEHGRLPKIEVEKRRWDDPDAGYSGWRCQHDGWSRNSYTHTRAVRLSNDGLSLEGFDRFEATVSGDIGVHTIDVRFHLHPSMEVIADNQTGLFHIWPRDDPHVGWTLSSDGATGRIDDTTMSEDGETTSSNKLIVLSARLDRGNTISWRFKKSYPEEQQ